MANDLNEYLSTLSLKNVSHPWTISDQSFVSDQHFLRPPRGFGDLVCWTNCRLFLSRVIFFFFCRIHLPSNSPLLLIVTGAYNPLVNFFLVLFLSLTCCYLAGFLDDDVTHSHVTSRDLWSTSTLAPSCTTKQMFYSFLSYLFLNLFPNEEPMSMVSIVAMFAAIDGECIILSSVFCEDGRTDIHYRVSTR